MMSTPRRRRRRFPRPDCSTLLVCLAVVAAGVWTVVHAVALWVTGHPGLIAVMLGLMVAGGAGGGVLAARRERAGAARLARADFLGLSPAGFEEALAGLCWRDGCRDVTVVGGAGDLAADVLATTRDGRRILIQAKRYAPGRRVGSPDVQRVGGTYSVVHGAVLAIVVTTAAFTAEAEGYARTAGIRLVDGTELATWAAGTTAPPWGGERRMRA